MEALVLAGGNSKRMGSDKALLQVNDHTLVEWVIADLLTVFTRVYLSCNNHLQSTFYALFQGNPQVVVVVDKYENQGPLGGLASVLAISPEPALFVKTVDVPFFQESLIHFMAQFTRDYPLVLPVLKGRLEPLFGFYQTRLHIAMELAIKKGNRRIHSFVESFPIRYIRDHELAEFVDENDPFFNINTPTDFFNWKRAFV
jgi:molybdenum cofactor guanylyltransferase